MKETEIWMNSFYYFPLAGNSDWLLDLVNNGIVIGSFGPAIFLESLNALNACSSSEQPNAFGPRTAR